MQTKLTCAAMAALAICFSSSLRAAPQDGYCHLPPWSAAAPETSGRFGRSVAMDAVTALVGADGSDEVHVYQRGGPNWFPTQVLSNPGSGESTFGRAVALDGDRCFVGAPFTHLQGDSVGVVHVYERGPFGWVHTHELVSPTPFLNGRFGTALSAHNGWLAVGAPDEANTGRVHVFDFASGTPQHVNSVSSLATSSKFGAAVALHRPAASSAGFVFVGDPADSTAGVNAGIVRYFRVHPVEIAFGAVLAPAQLDPGDSFGVSIAFDGQHLVVGASGDDDAAPSAGAAYVFDVPPPGPLVANFATKLTGPGAAANAFFGSSVAVSGSRIAVGATQQIMPGPGMGRVHLFRPAILGSSWVHDRMLANDAAHAATALGASLALSGNLVLAGAPKTSGQAGSAFLFSTAAGGLPGGLCPLPLLASAVEYGPAKAGSQGIPTISFNAPPTPGANAVFGAKGFAPGTTPILLIGAGPTWLPFDGGMLLVADPMLLSLPTVGPLGQVGIGFAVPDNPALVGVPICLQAIAIDPGLGAGLQTAQTRGLGIAVGY